MKRIATLLLATFLGVMLAMAGFTSQASAMSAADLAQQILGAKEEEPTPAPQAPASDAAVDQSQTQSQTDPFGDFDNLLESEAASGAEATPIPTPEIDYASMEENFRYTVDAVPQEGQQGGSGSVLLTMKPGDEQTVVVNVSNSGTRKITVSASTFAAFTNSNGVIQYSETDQEKDASLTLDFSEIVKPLDEVVSVEPGTIEPMRFSVKMPDDADFEGILLGGLVFAREPEPSELQESQMGIVNVYSYVITVRLQTSESESMEPAFEVVGVEANVQSVWGPQLVLSLRNPVPMMYRGLQIEFKVFNTEDMETPVYENMNNALEFAPNTTMPYSVRLNTQLPDGDYVLIGTLSSVLEDSGIEPFEIEVPFTVGGEEETGPEDTTEEAPAEGEGAEDTVAEEDAAADTSDEEEAAE